MAIGKVNAYATVEAPKADFGAVAQLNIDNLVKSAKEDEQLKAAKKAAADKAKQEREKDLKLFPQVTATGATAVDAFYLEQSKKDFDLSNQYKRDWIENGNYESKAKYESLVHHYGDMNNNLANFGAQVTKFSERAGDGKSLYKKNAEYGMNIVKSMNENRLRISRDDDGNVKFGIYKEEDGKMVLDKVVDQATYYKDINNPVPNIDIDADAKATKGVYEKSLTETYSGMTKKGVKELSEDAKKKIYEDCLSKVNDDNFAYVAGDTYGVIAKDDFKRSGFSDTEKTAIARKHADKIIGMFGKDVSRDTTFFAPDRGDGGKKDELGTVAIETETAVRNPVITGLSGFKTDKTITIPTNSMSYAIQPVNMKDVTKLNSVVGGKNGFATTPSSFTVTPEGRVYIVSNTAATEGYNVGVASGSGKIESETYVIPFGTDEFKQATNGIINLQPTWEIGNKKYKIKSSRDIYNYLSEVERVYNKRELPALKVSGSSSEADKLKI